MTEHQTWTIVEGSDVLGSDGEKFGTVDQVQPSYLVVRKGWFFPTDYYIPTSAISSATEDQVVLNVTKDTALNQGWETLPDATDTEGYVGETTYRDNSAITGTTAGLADIGKVTPLAGDYPDDADRDASIEDADRINYVDGPGHVDTDESIRVPLAEEELTATRRPVQRGEVRVEKDVVAEEQTLEVPVTEERVNVTRRTVDRDLRAGDAAFEEGDIEVPVRGEEVDVQKQARVVEEIELSKEAEQRTEQVSGTVRREEARVVDTTETIDDDELLDGEIHRR
jgi:uncharacterized protein (TIGR02271 family)